MKFIDYAFTATEGTPITWATLHELDPYAYADAAGINAEEARAEYDAFIKEIYADTYHAGISYGTVKAERRALASNIKRAFRKAGYSA